MASDYKNIAKLVGATGDVVISTCSAATQAIIKNITLYNSHSGSIVVYPKITDSSASLTVTLTGPFVLEASDTLILNCATASKIYAFCSVLEIS